MENEKNALRYRTRLHFILVTLWQGVLNLFFAPPIRAIAAPWVGGVTVLALFVSLLMWRLAPLLALAYIPAFVALWLAAVVLMVYRCGAVPGSRALYDDFVRAGFVNFAGEAPVLIRAERIHEHLFRYTFYGKGFSRKRWEDEWDVIETVINGFITDIQEGDDRRTILLTLVPATKPLSNTLLWKNEYLSAEDFVLVLGESVEGQVSINLALNAHTLIAASTGYGKTSLLKLIIWEALNKGASVTVADWKGGFDYSIEFRTCCRFVFDNDALLTALDDLLQEMERRKQLFLDTNCCNIAEYNASAEQPLCRHLLILDETSMILDATGRSKEDKKAIEEILNRLFAIGRLGRAFGIHLIVATQRPDTQSIPGQLKSLLDNRLCGHVADNVSSQVILDDASASDLPAVKGRFLLRDGTGHDKIFQAYYGE